jgi:Asp/Glu/hydantoin racemase
MPDVPARYLVLNPNTSEQVSRCVRDTLQQALAPGETAHVETAASGAAYIGSPEAMRTGTAAAQDSARRCLAAAHAGYDAIILACFADLGTQALARQYGLPVVNLLDAAIAQAAAWGQRWSVVTVGHVWSDLLPPLVQASPWFREPGQLVSVRTFDIGKPRAPDTEAALRAEISRQAALCIEQDHADVVIIGGAGLGGLCLGLGDTLKRPVIDSVLAGLEVARARTRPPLLLQCQS